MPLAVGTVVAGYRIEGVLGSGGMGTVYLARHPTLPRSDALKILSTELSLDGFNAYTGILVIVDDPATIAALNTGGPAANAYLNQALVNKLANQIH